MSTSYTFLPAEEPMPAAPRESDWPASAGGLRPEIGAEAQAHGRKNTRRSGGYGRVLPLPVLAYRLSDLAVPSCALLAALVLSNIGAMPKGLDQFLAVRISLKNLLLFAVLLACWRLICNLCGLYDWERIRSPREETRRVLLACTLGTATAVLFPLTSVSGAFSYASLGVYWLVGVGGMIGARRLLRVGANLRRPPVRNALLVGSGPRALAIESRLREDQSVRYDVLGFADTPTQPVVAGARDRLVTSLEDLPRFLMHSPVDEVILALPLKSRYAETAWVAAVCESLGIPVTLPSDILSPRHSEFRRSGSDSLLAVTLDESPDRVRLAIKRALDLLGGTVVLALCAPIMLLVAGAIKLTSRGPVFFVQERYGYNRRRFRMYKFRTMRQDAEQQQSALEHLNEAPGPLFKIREDPRVTTVGRLLRRWSMDELPQLFNVLRGDMSLVGPRPMSVRDALRLTEATLTRRFSVRPGMTGLWQVRGRCSLDYDSWVTYDLQYVAEWSVLLDCKILALTIPAVVRGTGAE